MESSQPRATSTTNIFVRDWDTLLAYAALAAYAYCLYALGPLLTFLHSELHLSNTLTSLHSSLWAAGTIVTGLSFDRFARRLGRHRLFWLSALGTVCGALLFMVSHTVVLTLLSAAVLGTLGTLLQTGTSAVLADRHGERRDRAYVEANIGASTAAVSAPLILGLLAGTAAGWRTGLIVPILALGALYLRFHAVRLPETPISLGSPSSSTSAHKRLPAAYWLLAFLVAAIVGVEFCVVFFGAELLSTETGISTARAATALSVFFFGELLGRIGGSGFTRRPGRARPLVLAALILTALGFSAFWLSGSVVIAIVGLFVTGLGVANLYPLTLALAVAAAPGQTDAATARMQVLIGLAVMLAPLALGALADRTGVVHAFLVEPALIVLAVLLLLAGRPARSR